MAARVEVITYKPSKEERVQPEILFSIQTRESSFTNRPPFSRTRTRTGTSLKQCADSNISGGPNRQVSAYSWDFQYTVRMIESRDDRALSPGGGTSHTERMCDALCLP